MLETNLRQSASSILIRGTALLWLACVPLTVSAASPDLVSVFPLSCPAGATTDVKLKGKQLKDIRLAQLTAPGVSIKVINDQSLQISVPAETPPGDYDLRVLTGQGLSQPHVVQLTAWPTITADEQADTPDSAETLKLPGGVDARFDHTGDIDWYTFTGSAGQTITIRCRSRSLGGSAEPLFTLSAPDGEEIAFASAAELEPALHLKLPETGTYRIKVFERAYRSDANSVYHLSVNTGPRLLAAFPALIPASKPSQLRIQGLDLPGVAEDSTQLLQQKTITVDPATDTELSQSVSYTATSPFSKGLWLQLPHTAGSVRLMTTDTLIVVDQDPENHSQTTAQEIKIPCDIAGQFPQPRDLDWYRFTAEKGQQLSLAAYGERLGQRMDLELSLFDDKGKLLLNLSDQKQAKGDATPISAASLDPEGTWKAPQSGTFYLLVRDLYGVSLGGFERQYRVRITKRTPDFRVFAYPGEQERKLGITLHPGGNTHVALYVDRQHGFDKPVRIHAVDLPEGLTADDIIIPKHQSAAVLSIQSNRELTPDILDLNLQATSEDQQLIREVQPLTVTDAGSFTQVNTLAAGIADPAPVVLTISPPQQPLTVGGKLELAAKLESHESSISSPIELKWHTAMVDAKQKSVPLFKPTKSIPPTQTKSKLTATLSDKLQPGEYLLWLSATTKVDSSPATDQKQKKAKPVPVSIVTNVITLKVEPEQNPKKPKQK
ncbi:hypothetical protein V6x_17960 [Gimesia chilikensis]|uniref:Peptidase C-terminal archaeal/bacterial domain-containing protein n=1 Tax=Gimesia chilikensis TaxID=2605989 RepID=A0A517WA11_9PLAN|nr:PPC domain-containing protein [Gimesia chilikensis]QDU02095.1 hypothetical protein V6x_17960 [Gimesia chilikensis]